MCTSIKLRNKETTVLAQNYDFYYGHGLIITNKKGVSKVALTDDLTEENLYSDENSGAKWKSKYGSITFNQFARELPTCGINEAGLTIVSMWHNTNQKPESQGKNQITELQWIQMQLDIYKSIDEVIEKLDAVSYGVKMYPMHYHLTDKTGDSVIIELVNGKLTAFKNASICACSNAGIKKSQEFSRKYSNINPENIKIDEPILDRASKAILLSQEYNKGNKPQNIITKAFEILDSVNLKVGFGDLFRWIGKGIPPSQTFLQVAFDVTNMKIFFKTKSNQSMREITISHFDFSSQTSVKVFDMEKGEKGDITDLFHDYSLEDNKRIVKKSFAPVKKEFSINEQNDLIKYPEILKVN
jgi:penicillin V acylase-like amidase (Ntn superfamily)